MTSRSGGSDLLLVCVTFVSVSSVLIRYTVYRIGSRCLIKEEHILPAWKCVPIATDKLHSYWSYRFTIMFSTNERLMLQMLETLKHSHLFMEYHKRFWVIYFQNDPFHSNQLCPYFLTETQAQGGECYFYPRNTVARKHLWVAQKHNRGVRKMYWNNPRVSSHLRRRVYNFTTSVIIRYHVKFDVWSL